MAKREVKHQSSKREVKHQSSKREQKHAEMLKEALARPGIREVMKVYQHYQQVDRGLDAYRLATRRRGKVISATRMHDKTK